LQKNRLGLIITGLLLGILVSAMDNTIVATAMATIVANLGGLDKFIWVTAAYMVTEMAGMPIFGKLSDMYGRKRFFVFGLIVFLVGSMLCGTAHSIVQLSLYRALQGVGGGALAPIAFTIMFDVVRPEQRGKLGGLFGAVFGLSSIFGPLLGAYITQYLDWRWVFYINVPIGIAAFVLITFFYKESYAHSQEKIDWLGVFTLVPAIAALMFGLQLGGNTYAWNSFPIISLFSAAAILFVGFLWAETKAVEPIISFAMFRNRLFAGSNVVALFSGASYVVAVLYIPIFIQGVLGGTATNSGLVLLPMMLGSVVSSQIGAMAVNKVSFRTIMIAFGVIFLIGISLLSTLTVDTSRLTVTLFMVLTGLGIGASFSVLSMAAMQPFDARQRGTASSTMNFVRELAMAVGITVFGIFQRNDFAARMTSSFAQMGKTAASGFSRSLVHADPHAMLAPAMRAHIPPTVLQVLDSALSQSIAHTFLWTVLPAALALLFAFFMGRDKLVPGMGWGAPIEQEVS